MRFTEFGNTQSRHGNALKSDNCYWNLLFRWTFGKDTPVEKKIPKFNGNALIILSLGKAIICMLKTIIFGKKPE